jgi:hypothetical protein
MTSIHELKSNKIIILLLIIYQTCFGQQKQGCDKYFTYGFNAGYIGYAPIKTNSATGDNFMRSTGFVAADNGHGNFEFTGNSSLGLNAGFLWQHKRNKNMTAIYGGVQQNRNSYVFDLPFKKKVPEYSGDGDADDKPTGDSLLKSTGSWSETYKYLHYNIAVQQLFYVKNRSLFLGGDKYRYFKLSFGENILYRMHGNIISEGDIDSGKDEKGNLTVASTTSANNRSYVAGIEVGIRSFSFDKKSSLDVGISWLVPFGSAYTRDYNFYKKTIPTGSPQGAPIMQPIGQESITYKGGSVLLNVTYNFNSYLAPKPIDTTFLFIKKDPPPQPIVHIHKPHQLNGRKVRLQEKINVGDSLIMADVWDHGKIDGDRISLFLNGKEILHDYTVGKVKKEIVLHLVPGKNYLVMHALNLGRIPPNTAAIELSDSEKKHLIILNSDLKKSGAIEIDCNPV